MTIVSRNFQVIHTSIFPLFIHIRNMLFAWLLHEHLLKSGKIKC